MATLPLSKAVVPAKYGHLLFRRRFEGIVSLSFCMYFFKRGGWQVQFLEADIKTTLPMKLTFSDRED